MAQRPVFKLIDINAKNVAEIANPVRWDKATSSYVTSSTNELWYQADADSEAVMILGQDKSTNKGLIIEKFVDVVEKL